jgi:hypothetical protein
VQERCRSVAPALQHGAAGSHDADRHAAACHYARWPESALA